MSKEKNFYKDLQTVNLHLTDVFRKGIFADVPGDWHVIIADVKDSTAAIKAGNHNDVNLVAASCLVIALNIAKAANIEIPFFFTGDGGTVFVPKEILDDVINGLKIHNNNSIKNFGLALHVGCMAIDDIKSAGHTLQIAKVRFSSNFSKPVIIGDGLKYAEQKIKKASDNDKSIPADPSLLNMEGLQCRWDKIKPPSEENEVVCYLIEAAKPEQHMEVYGNVLQTTDAIYGILEKRNPLSLDRLRLLISKNKIRKEMMVRFGNWKRNYIAATLIRTFLGQLYFKFNWKVNNLFGKDYLKQVVDNADTLTIDGRINTIISGSKDKRIQFLKYLDEQEKAGRLVYGHFISKESIMTCYIENMNEKHIHFVDGSDGGYTEAAKELKMKLVRVAG
jgi:hypothetical protein